MKTKILIKLLLMGIALLFVTSCSDFLDVNKDPNSPEDVGENLQLGALLGNFSYEVIANEPVRTPSYWIQQLAWNGVPPSSDNYDLTESDVNNLWTFFSYADVMKNARILNEQATETGNYNYAGIAKLILAWNLSIVTDLWNEAPYSQAFDPTNTTPEYDSQEQIYEAVFGLIDGAIADFNQNSIRIPGNDDLLYRGDMDRWKKLAYTLQARFHMRLSKAPGKSEATQAQAALTSLQNGFANLADDAVFEYFTTPGAENPWYQFAIDGKWDNRDQLSHHYVEMLRSLNDPRLPIQARPVGSVPANSTVIPDSFRGHINGNDGVGAANISSIGTFYSSPNSSVTWISYVEALFLRAEATFITSGAAAADPIYRDAIRASMDKLGVAAADRDTYVAARPALDATNGLRDIMIQKYIANFLNPEGYNDWRRNGYPELTPITNGPAIPTIPRRYPYPSAELQYNAANVAATGIPIGRTSMTFKVWWDTRP
jgi:hypothetical protein